MALVTLDRHQWATGDYQRMVAAGILKNVECLDGEMVTLKTEGRPYRWTLDDYERLIALGVLEGRHVELIQGDILTMAPC